MNRQDHDGKRGIEWTQPYGVHPGYTANPIKGCVHECRWRMPSGDIAICYAEAIANKFTSAYQQGFSHLRFERKELDAIENLKEPAGIFLDSMSDLCGAQVPDEWIKDVIITMRQCHRHLFFILTKNPPRLKHFEWPENAWLGVSAPPTFMFGKELSIEQQTRWYDKALETLGEIDVPIRWTSVEPLSFDVSGILANHFHDFEWAVIGAASNGAKTYQPDEQNFRKAYQAMGGKPVFLKGNIARSLADTVCGRWLEQWPMYTSDWRQARKSEVD